jgi:putative polyhydroxyalkanoate system protein
MPVRVRRSRPDRRAELWQARARQIRKESAMADVRINRKHHLSIAHAKKIAQKAADDLAEEYDLQSAWNGDTLKFERSGVNGEMRVTASHIDLELTLGFLLKPFKSKFESHISHRLDELLVAATPEPEVAKPAAKATGKAAAGKLAAGKSAGKGGAKKK